MRQEIKDTIKKFSLSNQDWLGIILTKNAANQMTKLMQQHPKSQGLQLNIKQSGCAGFSYQLKIATSSNNLLENLLFEDKGVKLYVPLKIMPFIDGTEVDYICEGFNQIFKFNNPKAQNFCGCGESFSV